MGVFIAYRIISFPLSLIMLFGMGLRHNLYYGLLIIWGSQGVGNIIGCICEIAYLIFCADWKTSVDQAMDRAKHTMSTLSTATLTAITQYHSTDNVHKGHV